MRPVPIPSSSAEPLVREPGEELHDGIDDGRIEHVRGRGVVARRDLFAEVVLAH